MRIDCPSCAARYVVPDEFIVPGRVMQCSRCAAQWAPPPPEPPPPEPPQSEPPPERPPPAVELTPSAPPADPPSEAPVPVVPPGGGGLALPIAWLASIALLAGLGWAAMTHQGQIEGAWPPSARLFAWLRAG